MSDQTSGGSTASSLLASATTAASDALGEARDRAADVASRTAKAARHEAMDRAEGAKDGLADQGERFAQTLRSALDQGDDSIQSKLMAAAADSVTDLSNTLRGKSFEQLMADAGEFAKRSPGAFVAAAALAGFAVARFARASAPAASAFGDIEGSGAGSAYGSPRQMGSGYASGGGMSQSRAKPVMQRLEAIADSTVISARFFDARMGPSLQMASNDSNVPTEGVMQLAVHGRGGSQSLEMNVEHYAGCYFVRF